MLYRTKDSLFSRNPSGITNAVNFAINSRIFDPTDIRPMMPQNVDLNAQYRTPVVTD